MRRIELLLLLGTLGATGGRLVAADPAIAASGIMPTHVAQHAATVIDPYLTLAGGTVPGTILVSIGTGFTVGDTLDCDASIVPGASASYDEPIGVLTLTGPTTLDDWRTLLRHVVFAATGYGTGTRTVVFSIGGLVAHDNGHFYEYVPGSVTWSAARAGAAARTYQGAAGYLATITTADECDFVRTKLNDASWIGASDAFAEINAAAGSTVFADQAASEGHWYWVTGPEAGTNFSNGTTTPATVTGRFANWNAGEPNNDSGSEDYASMLIGVGTGGEWNDLPDAGGLTSGYVVEYGGLAPNDLAGSSAYVTVNVTPDLLPVATGQSLTTPEDTDLVVDLIGSDADGDALAYSATPPTGHGRLYQYDAGMRGAEITVVNTPVTDSAHRVIYAPPADASGILVDLFYFRVHDGTLYDLAYVLIDVDAINDPPVWLLEGSPFAGDDHRTSAAGAVEDLGAGTFQVADADAGSAPMQITLSADHGTLALPATGLDFAFTPDATGSPIGAGGTGSTLCFRGARAAVNTALDALTLTNEPGWSGTAHLAFAANDLGSTGGGGPRIGTALYRLDVAAAPAAPAPAKSDDRDTWAEKATGCGSGSGIALIGVLGSLLLVRRRQHL